MVAIFKSSLQTLSPLPTSLKVKPLAKPKTSLKFFVNTTKPETKVLTLMSLCEIGPRKGHRTVFLSFSSCSHKIRSCTHESATHYHRLES